MPSISCLSIVGFFLRSLSELNRKFAGLFTERVRESNESGSRVTETEFPKELMWFQVLDNLSNNDRTKWDYFINMNVIAFLNTLQYYRIKEKHLDYHRRLMKHGNR